MGTTFTAFPCTDTPSGDQSFLTVDMSINCDSPRYDAGFALAVTVGLVLYARGGVAVSPRRPPRSPK